MQDVPKIVRERLKAGTSAVDHVDADVLTAFAEQALPERERNAVLDHLARCGDCRDVVALALPATEEAETAIVAPRRGWLTWPALRWGFVAAGVVVIVGFGVLQLQRRSQRATIADFASPRSEATGTESRPQSPAPPMATSPSGTEKLDKAQPARGLAAADSATIPNATPTEPNVAPVETPREGLHAGPGHGSAGAAFGRPLPHGPTTPAQLAWQNNAQNNVQNNAQAGPQLPVPVPAPAKQQGAAVAVSPQIPSVSETVEVQSAAGAVNTETRSQDEKVGDPSADQRAVDYYAPVQVGKAKPSVTVEAANGVPDQTGAGAGAQQELPLQAGNSGVSGRNLAQLIAVAPASAPRWTISSTGGLQRSFDQGNSWQDVDVNANFVGFADFTSLEVVTKSARAKEKDDNEDKKALKRKIATMTFRAVAAIGADVWAGGSGGMLYHSPDAGSRWTRVVPSSGGSFLTADIIRLEFPDPQHGKIMTSVPEVWTTSDAGLTWQKK